MKGSMKYWIERKPKIPKDVRFGIKGKVSIPPCELEAYVEKNSKVTDTTRLKKWS